jgi:hypothetical protein
MLLDRFRSPGGGLGRSGYKTGYQVAHDQVVSPAFIETTEL